MAKLWFYNHCTGQIWKAPNALLAAGQGKLPCWDGPYQTEDEAKQKKEGSFNQWFYNDVSGAIIHITQKSLADVQGKIPSWHGFKTKAEAEAYKNGHKPSVPALGAAGDLAKGAVDVGGFLSALTNKNTWLRVAEVSIGVLLLVVGLVKLTNAASVVSSATPAGKVIKALK